MLICDAFSTAIGSAAQTKKVYNSYNLNLRILDNVKWKKYYLILVNMKSLHFLFMRLSCC